MHTPIMLDIMKVMHISTTTEQHILRVNEFVIL